MKIILDNMNAKSVQALIVDATKDPEVAQELKKAAETAQKSGIGSPEWDALMGKFFSDPNDLAMIRLVQTGDPRISPQWTPTTITTITTLTTMF